MGNQTICNCIYAKKLEKNLNIESNENTQEKQNNEEIIISNPDNNSSNTFNCKKLKKSVTSCSKINANNVERKSSYQDPELSFVTIHLKTSKK